MKQCSSIWSYLFKDDFQLFSRHIRILFSFVFFLCQILMAIILYNNVIHWKFWPKPICFVGIWAIIVLIYQKFPCGLPKYSLWRHCTHLSLSLSHTHTHKHAYFSLMKIVDIFLSLNIHSWKSSVHIAVLRVVKLWFLCRCHTQWTILPAFSGIRRDKWNF